MVLRVFEGDGEKQTRDLFSFEGDERDSHRLKILLLLSLFFNLRILIQRLYLLKKTRNRQKERVDETFF